jgi:voltage-gated potassium channel
MSLSLPDAKASRGAATFIKWCILASVLSYFIEVEIVGSIDSLHSPPCYLWFERAMAMVFTAEYVLRIKEAGNKKRYLQSPMGIIDLLSILPFWLGFFVPDHMLGLVRSLRVIRLTKFYRYSKGLQNLFAGLEKERGRLVAVGQVVLVTLALSTAAIHAAEGDAQPDKFGKLSHSLWWSVVTMTTVGYGDAAPITNVGRIIAMVLMVVGIGVVGSFLGIFGSAMFQQKTGETYE